MTFETLVMEPELRKAIVDDIHRFVKRKDLYKRVGWAWKRVFGLLGRGDFLEDEAGMSSKLGTIQGVKNQVNGIAIEGGTKASIGATMELESAGSRVDKTRREQRQLGSSPIPVDRTKAITCCAEERWKVVDFEKHRG
ncbi:hypothetical protein Ancab_027981 [Ancistrocladus abbreviatus]